jgi:competence protein ComEA
MRTAYFSSLVFALLACASIAVNAAPAKPEVSAPVAAQVASAAQTSKINLNQADAATLHRELSGIGEAKAKEIVAYRESNGPFTSVDELLEVKGIGKAILDKNREKLEIK